MSSISDLSWFWLAVILFAVLVAGIYAADIMLERRAERQAYLAAQNV